MTSHRDRVTLNPSQRQRLLVTCKHIDKLLADIEATLDAASSKSIFAGYVNDITAGERTAIEKQIAGLRGQLLQIMASQSLTVEESHISASHSIHVALSFIEIAVEELAPEHMRGYGPVSPEGANDLQTVIADLQCAVRNLYAVLQTYADSSVGEGGSG